MTTANHTLLYMLAVAGVGLIAVGLWVCWYVIGFYENDGADEE